MESLSPCMGGEEAKTKPKNIFQLENLFSHLAVNPMLYLSRILQAFPGGSVVQTLCSHCQGPEFDPWSGN